MQRVLIAAAFIGLAAGSASAAPPPPVAVQIYNWTGFYIGGDVGSWRGKTSLSINDIGPLGQSDMSPRSFIGGGHVGLRYQFQSNFVLGVEGDIWGLTGHEDVQANTDMPLGMNFKATSGGSVRGVAGYAINNILIYGTGGGSWIRTTGCSTLPAGGPCGTIPFDAHFSGTPSGWTAGGGIEWAIWQNWSARVQYLHAEYRNYDYPSLFYVPPSVVRGTNFTTDDVRFGISYQFGNWPFR